MTYPHVVCHAKTMKLISIWILMVLSVTAVQAQFNSRQRKIEYSPDTISSVTRKPVLIPAEPVGGMPRLYRFIGKKLRYPKDARRENIQGRVFVEFFVDEYGKLPPDSVRVVKGLSPTCDKEAVRVIKASPRWIPGKIADTGEPVAQRMVLPITFRK